MSKRTPFWELTLAVAAVAGLVGFLAGFLVVEVSTVQPLRMEIETMQDDLWIHSQMRKAGLDVWCRWAYENDALESD